MTNATTMLAALKSGEIDEIEFDYTVDVAWLTETLGWDFDEDRDNIPAESDTIYLCMDGTELELCGNDRENNSYSIVCAVSDAEALQLIQTLD